jgi:hypothetical protein
VAATILSSMFFQNGISLPPEIEPHLRAVQPFLGFAHITFDGINKNNLIGSEFSVGLLLILLLVVWYMPNTQQLLARYRPALGFSSQGRPPRRGAWLVWRPNFAWSLILAVTGAAALVQLWIGGNAEFLYFQF